MNSPTFFPAESGETVVSIAAMVSKTTNLANVRKLFRGGIRRGLLLYSTLPCRTHQFCSATADAYGGAIDVLLTHTLHAFSSAGMSATMAEQAAHAAAYGTASRTMYPRLPLGVECSNRYGLQCPECARDALIRTGRRVSYCAHCIPYVTRCPWHDCRLVCDCECSSFERRVSQESGVGRASNSLSYAKMALALLEESAAGPLWEDIRAILEDKGYYAGPRRLRTRLFHEDFCRVFSAGFEDARLNYIVRDWSAIPACIRAATRADRAAPAPVLVLLNWAAHELDHVRIHALRPPSASVPTAEPAAACLSKRAQWKDHISSHPDQNRTQLRRSRPDLWSWLYRHDLLWLRDHQVSPSVVARRKRPATIPSFVSEAMLEGHDPREHHDGREPLPSVYQMRLAYGMTEYFFIRATERLCGLGRGGELPGARAVFIKRRLQSAAAALALRGLSPNITSLSREARLRVSTARRFPSNDPLV